MQPLTSVMCTFVHVWYAEHSSVVCGDCVRYREQAPVHGGHSYVLAAALGAKSYGQRAASSMQHVVPCRVQDPRARVGLHQGSQF